MFAWSDYIPKSVNVYLCFISDQCSTGYFSIYHSLKYLSTLSYLILSIYLSIYQSICLSCYLSIYICFRSDQSSTSWRRRSLTNLSTPSKIFQSTPVPSWSCPWPWSSRRRWTSPPSASPTRRCVRPSTKSRSPRRRDKVPSNSAPYLFQGISIYLFFYKARNLSLVLITTINLSFYLWLGLA